MLKRSETKRKREEKKIKIKKKKLHELRHTFLITSVKIEFD